MTSPLDDAPGRLDARQNPGAAGQEDQDQNLREFSRRFHQLVGDFLSRMNSLGNPGADREWKEGRLRRVRGWYLAYDDRDEVNGFLLTVDGRIPQAGALVPFTEFLPDVPDYRLAGAADRRLSSLAASMAAVLASARPKTS